LYALDIIHQLQEVETIFTQMEQKENKFIVAIGASAGGLKPLQEFFDSTPNDHATYIILRHLKPDYKSILGDTLQKHSKLEIIEAENGTLIDQNKVYMLPSGMYMTIKGDRLYLQPRNSLPLYPNVAIDIFLQSLAEEKGDESIAVILSGLGFDGAKGAKIIKDKGGIVIVQKPQSADYNSMPLSVINNGVADYQLLPEEMPDTILNHINKWIKNNEDK
jgi:chemotaxis response regulator CheB